VHHRLLIYNFMRNLIVSILVLLLAACGMGKKGDGISHRPKKPESMVYVLTEWHQISDVDHIPIVRKFEHSIDNRLKIFEAYGILVDARNRYAFNATWRGPGKLIGNTLINYDSNHTVLLRFVIEEPDYGLITYSLVLERYWNGLVGLETIEHKSGETIMQLVFTRDDL